MEEFQLRREVKSPRPLCRTVEEYTQGEWVRNTSIDTYPYLSGDDYEWGPMCMEMQNRYLKDGTVPEFLQYQWKPHTCDILPFSKEQFCKVLDGNTIGTIGDSIMQQFAHSFIGLFHGKIDDVNFVFGEPDWYDGVPYYSKLRVPLCQEIPNYNNVTLLFYRWNKYQPDATSRQVLGEIAKASDYLILNWGVHYLPWSEMDVATQDFIEVLRESWGDKRSERIFWRSTIVAHEQCQNATSPEKSSAGHFDTNQNPDYNTDEILLQDEFIVRPRFLESALSNVTFLRIEPSTMLRKDGHRVTGRKGAVDCLHYCEPGPVDSWVELFYHRVAALNIWQCKVYLPTHAASADQRHMSHSHQLRLMYMTCPDHQSVRQTAGFRLTNFYFVGMAKAAKFRPSPKKKRSLHVYW